MRLHSPVIPIVSLAAVLLTSPGSMAQEGGGQPDRASSREFLRFVIDSPALSGAARRINAAERRVDAAGLLPNPEIEGMISQMDGAMGERNRMWEVNVRQPLPKRGERAAQRDRARAGVAMAAADYALMAGEMAADTAMALAEIEGGLARIQLLEAQLARLDALLRSLEVRLAAGTQGRLAERLTVQSQIAAMQLMLEGERRMVGDAQAEARARLGLAPDVALPEFCAPVATEVSAHDAAAIRLATARADEADAMGKMARATANPMTAVGLRFERGRTAMGNEDTVGIAFMSELPFRSRRASRAELRATAAERAAAQADASVATYRIAAALTRVERAERLADIARRLSGETLDRLNAEYDAMIRSASAGSPMESTVLLTIELLEKATEADLRVIEARQAARAARAELWRYVPAEWFTWTKS
ncbi:MAG: TolC family protein [Candidatus Didemnitutus sp.]|nr:TolC family protein [Candidatus Didemnitutus sp.]